MARLKPCPDTKRKAFPQRLTRCPDTKGKAFPQRLTAYPDTKPKLVLQRLEPCPPRKPRSFQGRALCVDGHSLHAGGSRQREVAASPRRGSPDGPTHSGRSSRVLHP